MAIDQNRNPGEPDIQPAAIQRPSAEVSEDRSGMGGTPAASGSDVINAGGQDIDLSGEEAQLSAFLQRAQGVDVDTGPITAALATIAQFRDQRRQGGNTIRPDDVLKSINEAKQRIDDATPKVVAQHEEEVRQVGQALVGGALALGGASVMGAEVAGVGGATGLAALVAGLGLQGKFGQPEQADDIVAPTGLPVMAAAQQKPKDVLPRGIGNGKGVPPATVV